MQKFSDYIKSNNSKSEKVNNGGSDDIKTKEDVQSKIDEYSTYSSDRLLNEFLKLTMEKKRKGELTEVELEKLKRAIEPMLSSEQKQSLENILQMVRNVK